MVRDAGQGCDPNMSGRPGEIIFVIKEAPEGGFLARALGHGIFTEADTLEGLRDAMRNAVCCHFDEHHHVKIIERLCAPGDLFACFDEWTSEPDTEGYSCL